VKMDGKRSICDGCLRMDGLNSLIISFFSRKIFVSGHFMTV